MAYSPGDILLYKYRIEKRLGSASTGELYQVTHLARNALRMLQVVSRADANVTEELFRQANDEFQAAVRLSSQISHPNLLQMLDCDANADLLALLMEDAPGGSLAGRMTQVPSGTAVVSPGEAVRLATQIADGLQALHSRGYVHGDVQPSNIFLDEQGQVKLGGLGKANMPGYSFELFPALAAVVSDYASPEQIASPRNLSFPADIYALGGILFWLISGRMYSKQKPVTKVSALALRAPEWLSALILRMLSPDPRLRPADGAAAAALLRRAGQVAAPAPASPIPQTPPVELLPDWVAPLKSLAGQIPGKLEALPAKIEQLPAKVKQIESRQTAPPPPPLQQNNSRRPARQGFQVSAGLVVLIIFFIILCILLAVRR
jgi:serine/threonine protein kinase